MKFNCENCGKINEALMNGYPFGDRILEDVMFKVTKNDDGTCKVESVDDWDNDSYLCGLNKKYWHDRAKDFAEEYDVFECPTCHDDAYPDDMLE